MNDLVVAGNEADLTAFELLRRRLPSAPPSYLRQLLRKGRIQRNGEALGADCVLRSGDRLHLPGSRRLRELMEAANAQAVEILYENEGLLAAFKPSGLAVHGGEGHDRDHLLGRLQALVASRGEPYSIAPAHRLDVPTSGPVLFGKGRKATAVLGRLFMAGELRKTYWALAAGTLAAEGRLTTPIAAKGKWKEARTDYLCRATAGGYSLLELVLHSGRTHQIRKQLADAGHPLAGDRRYGGPCPPGLSRLFLHCCRLDFIDPFGGGRLLIASPLPSELAAFLALRGLAATDDLERDLPIPNPHRSR